MKKASKQPDVKKVVLPHSQAKLDLYKSYLEHYLRVLCLAEFCNKINLYDIFCGVGLYEDGNMGSPLLASECIKETHKQLESIGKPIKPISLNINDKESDKIEIVKKLLNERRLSLCSYNFFNKDADDMLDIVIREVNTAPKTNRNLVFIDPYGYSKIHKEKIQELLRSTTTEIILFLPVMQMYRFKSAALTDYARTCFDNLRKFIFSFFPKSHKIHTDGIESIFEFINEIKKALTFDGKFFSSSHYIERDKGNYYALFYITPHLYGLEKMLEAKWNLDPIKGKGFNQVKTQCQPGLFDEQLREFDQRKEHEFLARKILNAVSEAPEGINNRDIYLLSLLNEFRPTHASTVLKDLIRNRKIKPINPSNSEPFAGSGFGVSYKDYKANNVKVIFKK